MHETFISWLLRVSHYVVWAKIVRFFNWIRGNPCEKWMICTYVYGCKDHKPEPMLCKFRYGKLSNCYAFFELYGPVDSKEEAQLICDELLGDKDALVTRPFPR